MKTTGLPVRLAGVSCAHGGRTVVRAVSLDVPAGHRVALTGTNGSGKTTLLRAVLGLHRACDGVVEVGARQARTAADWTRRRREIAWIPQRQAAGRFPLLVDELLASSGAVDRAREAARELGVGDLGRQPVHTLSGGQLQRAYLARAIGCVEAGAGVLLADEPTAALDFAGQTAVAELLTSLPVTVVVVTHDRAVAARCERVLEMAAGSLREIT
ncbi:ATP-binding cassette domain-containing protein [Lentzea sp. NPDC003310]|uniref:metal ABC transporter ATP-binding protein n=1 Tax=Lentzea sp. NPDC003310 TaxID=3154447 RepID=UPI0033B6DCEF